MQILHGQKNRCALTKAESKKQRNEVVGEVIKVQRGGKRKAREETDEEEDEEEEEKEKENVWEKKEKDRRGGTGGAT